MTAPACSEEEAYLYPLEMVKVTKQKITYNIMQSGAKNNGIGGIWICHLIRFGYFLKKRGT